MNRIHKFLQLPRPDQGLLIQAMLGLTVVTLGLRLLPWLTLQRLLLKLANRVTRGEPAQRPSPHRLGWAIRVASRYVPQATCLPQALMAQFLLHQWAYSADLRIGVTKNKDEKLEAHAWVICGDEIISGAGGDPDRFKPLSPTKKRKDAKDYANPL
ncbi:MAG TPA: lasso peptide biosynthesis B2 protein [Anaerolineae bacterium]|nr:lasso peptide biosynthesis B2 protein [Anaerolineae bacterium]HMR64829.1 lasso peptide biosynthesis B2 protein [Anaerolineae bacterium]